MRSDYPVAWTDRFQGPIHATVQEMWASQAASRLDEDEALLQHVTFELQWGEEFDQIIPVDPRGAPYG